MRNVININQPQSALKKKGLYIKTFGCQMNEYDSEKVAGLLASSCRTVETLEEADVVFVNTCSVRAKGEHKLFSLLGKIRDLKKIKPDLVLGVGGCVAQQEGQAIIDRNQAVDFIVGTHNLSLVPSMVKNALAGLRGQVSIDYRDEWEDLPDAFLPVSEIQPGGLLSRNVRALVSIQRGCNKNCSYCVVPFTRGKEVSRSIQEILRETKFKVSIGAKEVLLLGQTVNSYGRDLNPRLRFEDLIQELAKIDGLRRIRFISPHPQDVRPGFIELYKSVPQLCPHIHLPLQSGSNRLLKAMNRNYRIERYLEIVSELRKMRPDIAISTDIIVGFPTESDEDFTASLDIMRQVNYSNVYSFLYSTRPNTVAEKEYDKSQQVPLEIARSRLQVLQALQENMSLEYNENFIGKQTEVLVECPDKKLSSFMGRSLHNTLVEVAGQGFEPGMIINAQVERATPYGLKASYNLLEVV